MATALRTFSLVFAALSLLSATAFAGTPSEWKSRTIYQIVVDRFNNAGAVAAQRPLADNITQPPTPSCATDETWCGGTYAGIQAMLPYITGMGFDAIWISPVVKSYSYHGYDAQNIYEINPHFGGADGLHSLISAAHQQGVWVMFDVVGNHMGIPPNYDFSQLVPFNEAQYFHDCSPCPSNCQIQNFNDQNQVELCRLDGLSDLNQSNVYVANTLTSWVRTLVANFSADGLRVDTVPEVQPSFWTSFQQAAQVYAVGEVFNGNTAYVAPYQNNLDGLLSYPMYFVLLDTFARKQSMYNLRTQVETNAKSFRDVSLLGVFSDNHDNPRFLSINSDQTVYKACLTFVLFSTGIPIVYQGTEQAYNGAQTPANRLPLWLSGFPTSTDLYKFLSTVITWRKKLQVWNYPQVNRYVTDNFYAFSCGDAMVVTTNVGSQGPAQTETITYLPYKAGTKVCNALAAGDCTTVSSSGLTVTLNNGETKIYYSTSS